MCFFVCVQRQVLIRADIFGAHSWSLPRKQRFTPQYSISRAYRESTSCLTDFFSKQLPEVNSLILTMHHSRCFTHYSFTPKRQKSIRADCSVMHNLPKEKVEEKTLCSVFDLNLIWNFWVLEPTFNEMHKATYCSTWHIILSYGCYITSWCYCKYKTWIQSIKDIQ